MRSRASFRAHPIHPALIPFPFAFLTFAALFDVAAMLWRAELWSLTAAYVALAGMITGVLAAIPGIIDYRHTVPPRSSAKVRATKHALGNTAALVLFAVAFVFRHPDWTASTITLLLQLAGLGVLSYAGWLGGTLVTRNLVSVDHRYADAGKWQEAAFTGKPGDEIVVARAADLKDGHMKLLHVNGRRIALARTADGYHAVDDGCSHRGASLAGGVLVGDTVQCLWHGSRFDVRTGAVTCGPAKTGIRVYAVRVDNGEVRLRVP